MKRRMQSDIDKESTKWERKVRGRRQKGWHGSQVQSSPSNDGDNDDNDNVAGPSRIQWRARRHPPWLRGRAIGLWYAKQNRSQNHVKSIQVVTMPSEKAEEIRKMLGDVIDDKHLVKQEIAVRAQCSGQTEDSCVNLRPDNDFYQNFLRHQAETKTIEESEPLVKDVPVNNLIKRDKNLDEKLWHDAKFKNSAKFCEMQEYRRQLPSYRKMQEILQIIENHQVVVITGETGCGKTTQVPQYILDSYIRSGDGSLCHIICTQPRRISAISVAERVAEERDETISNGSVGYHIRLENKCPSNRGSILFCTTGVVLKYLEGDPYLTRASHLILDEIHERGIDSDFLMAIIKNLLTHRRDLKLVLMSATLNASKFSRYFGNCPMVNIPGFTYPVKEFYLEDVLQMTGYNVSFRQMKTFQQMRKWRRRKSEAFDKEDEYEACFDTFLNSLRGKYSDDVIDSLRNMNESKLDSDLIVELVKYICLTQPNGAILVFLPGWDQIGVVNNSLTEDPFYSRRHHLIIPLHSKMPTVNQREIFERPFPGVRKIILATNIAETSITINDVVYVVDCGKIKVTNFLVANNLATLTPEWVSLANARQRRGRAGRVQPGVCYHLYTKLRENFLEDYLLPEIQRTRLEQLCLRIKILKLGKIKPVASKTMDPPHETALDLAITMLQKLNALDSNENLTPLGYHLAKLPLDPQTGKMIMFGAFFGCLSPILTVAASLSFTDPFHTPLGKEQQVDKIRQTMSENSKSDHIMLIKAYQGWELARSRGNEYSYCRRNFLSSYTLKMLEKMRSDLAEELHQVQFINSPRPDFPASNINSDNLKLVRAVICAGLYPNVARISGLSLNKNQKKAPRIYTREDGRIYLHKKSVNCNERDFVSPWMVYYQKLKSTAIFLHDSTMVAPFPLIFFGGKVTFSREGETELISVDDHIQFHCTDEVARLTMQLRIQLDNLLYFKISHPGATDWDPNTREGAIIRAIIELITSEEILIVKQLNVVHNSAEDESQDTEEKNSDDVTELSEITFEEFDEKGEDEDFEELEESYFTRVTDKQQDDDDGKEGEIECTIPNTWEVDDDGKEGEIDCTIPNTWEGGGDDGKEGEIDCTIPNTWEDDDDDGKEGEIDCMIPNTWEDDDDDDDGKEGEIDCTIQNTWEDSIDGEDGDNGS